MVATFEVCAATAGPAFDEYQVKAAFLYNFAKFVEWPPSAFASSSEPISICIAGQNPFGSALEDMVRGKVVGGRSFAVRSLTDPQQAGKCQILFVGASERKRAWFLLDQINRTGILTVGEADEFTSIGGMVNLKLDGTRVRIQISLESAERANLKISSKLLGLAEIVKK